MTYVLDFPKLELSQNLAALDSVTAGLNNFVPSVGEIAADAAESLALVK